jgi:hypothetical protein
VAKPQLRAAANGAFFRQVTMRSVSGITWADWAMARRR